jgi:hypothetical protein
MERGNLSGVSDTVLVKAIIVEVPPGLADHLADRMIHLRYRSAGGHAYQAVAGDQRGQRLLTEFAEVTDVGRRARQH